MGRTGWLSSSNPFTLTASSSLDGFPPENAVPTSSSSWSAGENDDEQWIQVSDVINMLVMLTKKPQHKPPYGVMLGGTLYLGEFLE